MLPVAPSNLRLLDLVLIVLLLVALPLWDHFIDTPRTRKSLEAGTFNPINNCVRTMITLWALVLLLALDWWAAGRDPKSLGLAVHMDTRFTVGSLLTAVVMVLFTWQFFRIRRFSD